LSAETRFSYPSKSLDPQFRSTQRRFGRDASPAGWYRHPLIDNKVSRRGFMSDTLERLNQVFQEVFDDDDLAVGPSTTADDVEGWDSLMHVTLMIRVEKAFGVKFTSSQVAGLKNVGQLVELLDHKLGN
jgi:acyl carrier protein